MISNSFAATLLFTSPCICSCIISLPRWPITLSYSVSPVLTFSISRTFPVNIQSVILKLLGNQVKVTKMGRICSMDEEEQTFIQSCRWKT